MQKVLPIRLLMALALGLMTAVIGAPPTLASPVVYESEVTRIDYADGTCEIFGYDAGEQFDWRYSKNKRAKLSH